MSKIKDAILKVLEGALIEIKNPQGDGLHFNAVVVAPQFVGKSLIEQHRLVMGALSDLFETSLHAMKLETYTPEEWEKEKQ
ncbi:MAG: BolA family transcriptional regulator [Chlamydiia bacterium]|nr:BolA family transcriptional regulator [Chlamydiia bacterium]